MSVISDAVAKVERRLIAAQLGDLLSVLKDITKILVDVDKRVAVLERKSEGSA